MNLRSKFIVLSFFLLFILFLFPLGSKGEETSGHYFYTYMMINREFQIEDWEYIEYRGLKRKEKVQKGYAVEYYYTVKFQMENSELGHKERDLLQSKYNKLLENKRFKSNS